jgi:hypothetical protein
MAKSVSSTLVTPALVWLLFASTFAAGETKQRGVPRRTAGEIMKEQASGEHLTADDTILDLLNHPAFAGFGRLLLPWDDRGYDNSMRLRNVSALLPYHSHVDPGTVVIIFVNSASRTGILYPRFVSTPCASKEFPRINALDFRRR